MSRNARDWRQHLLRRASLQLMLAMSLLTGMTQAATAKTWSYRGLMELDHGSSIPGIPRYSRYDVDFTLDRSVLDTDHCAWENGLENANGIRDITTQGYFATPFVSLRFTKDPTGPATPDLSDLFFDHATRGASIVKGANQPPNPDPPLCDGAPAPLSTSIHRSATREQKPRFSTSSSIAITARCMRCMVRAS